MMISAFMLSAFHAEGANRIPDYSHTMTDEQNMIVFIDDGSTNIKMQWFGPKNAIQRHCSPNSFKRGFRPSFGESKAYNYTLNLQPYSFDPISSETEKTTQISYQYSPENVVAVHHALHTSGIEPQPLDIYVTLPLSEYFTSDNEPNTVNIQRKIDNLMQPLEAHKRNGFTIERVEVMPEAIPAGFLMLEKLPETQSLLIIDLGGTTLDIAQVLGQASGITKIYGAENVGVSIMTNAVRDAMVAAKTPCSAYLADLIIQHRNDDAFLLDHLNDTDHLPQLKKALADSQQRLIQQVFKGIDLFRDYTHIMVIGGGAELVADAVKSHCNIRDDRFYKTATSQFDLVDGMHRMTQE